MAWYWWLLVAVVVILWVAALIDIIRRRHEMSGVKLFTWLILIIVFPLVGVVAYFIVHGAGPAMPGPVDAERATRYPGGGHGP